MPKKAYSDNILFLDDYRAGQSGACTSFVIFEFLSNILNPVKLKISKNTMAFDVGLAIYMSIVGFGKN